MEVATQDSTHESSRLDTLKRVCINTHDQFEKIVKSARLDPGRAVRYSSAGMEYTSQMARKIDDLLSNEDDCVTLMEEPGVDDLVGNDLARKSESDSDKQAILDFVDKFKKKFKGRMNWEVCYAAAAKDPSLSNAVAGYANAVSFIYSILEKTEKIFEEVLKAIIDI
ncbi:hypothetical protein EDC94DRAFT_676219 [Helicostylum pulchrum]|nr:hypothetical protein EDC94DRAFT_676219 [Helicostylum pulchrum]